jgi:hypothetical protein
MTIKHFDVELRTHKLELIVDLERNHWYVLFPKYGQYASGDIGHGSFERNHNFLMIGSRPYSLVIDCDDERKHWEGWSFFDENKQDYMPDTGRLDGEPVWKVYKENGKLLQTVYSQEQAEFEVVFQKQQGKTVTFKKVEQ